MRFKKSIKTKKQYNKLRKIKKSRKYIKIKKSKTLRKYIKKQKGGRWVSYSDVDRNDICRLCNKKFYDTPDKAIYITNCDHLFHNNCLNKLCEENNGELTCPTCHQDEINCMGIWAFEKKRLGTPGAARPPGVEEDEIFEIYSGETGVPQSKKKK